MTVREALETSGLRPTEIRKEVLTILYDKEEPLTHGEIRHLARQELDRVTLYRTLDSMTEKGLVHRVQGVDGTWRYCAHPLRKPGCPGDHPHFLCLECGRMICLEDQALPFVKVPEGFQVDGKQLVVYGLCPDCRKHKSPDR
jgi:Fur family ferric uptake transcriptional regulator/Fur family zinc uptake transcriptional regulator